MNGKIILFVDYLAFWPSGTHSSLGNITFTVISDHSVYYRGTKAGQKLINLEIILEIVLFFKLLHLQTGWFS